MSRKGVIPAAHFSRLPAIFFIKSSPKLSPTSIPLNTTIS